MLLKLTTELITFEECVHLPHPCVNTGQGSFQYRGSQVAVNLFFFIHPVKELPLCLQQACIHSPFIAGKFDHRGLQLHLLLRLPPNHPEASCLVEVGHHQVLHPISKAAKQIGILIFSFRIENIYNKDKGIMSSLPGCNVSFFVQVACLEYKKIRLV